MAGLVSRLKGPGRADLLFVILFFAVTAIPMAKIDFSHISIQENRRLTPFKPLFADHRFNRDFGPDFDTWFSDRFNGRAPTLRCYSAFRYRLNRYAECESCYLGEDSWLFTKAEPLRFRKPELGMAEKNVGRLRDFCSEHGIAFYLLIIPSKEELYAEKTWRLPGDRINPTIRLARHLEKTLDFTLLYPLEALTAAKAVAPVMFKPDHHMTDWGAYQCYRFLAARISQAHPDVRVAGLDAFTASSNRLIRADHDRTFDIGSYYRMLNVRDDDRFLDIPYLYLNINKDVRTTRRNREGQTTFTCPTGSDKKVYLMGNSFIENIAPLLSGSFKQVKKVRVNRGNDREMRMSRFEDDILAYKPDILILMFESHYSAKLLELYDNRDRRPAAQPVEAP